MNILLHSLVNCKLRSVAIPSENSISEYSPANMKDKVSNNIHWHRLLRVSGCIPIPKRVQFVFREIQDEAIARMSSWAQSLCWTIWWPKSFIWIPLANTISSPTRPLYTTWIILLLCLKQFVQTKVIHIIFKPQIKTQCSIIFVIRRMIFFYEIKLNFN